MSVVSTDEVRVLIATGIEEAELQSIIDREEARLAARLKTPLTGGVDALIVRPGRIWDPLLLSRLPDPESVSVKENDIEIEVVVDGARVRRATGSWHPPLALAYDFADEDEVKAVVIGLIQLTLTDSPYAQEGTEGHSYSRSETVDRQRSQLIATLNPHRGRPVSVPM